MFIPSITRFYNVLYIPGGVGYLPSTVSLLIVILVLWASYLFIWRGLVTTNRLKNFWCRGRVINPGFPFSNIIQNLSPSNSNLAKFPLKHGGKEEVLQWRKMIILSPQLQVLTSKSQMSLYIQQTKSSTQSANHLTNRNNDVSDHKKT